MKLLLQNSNREGRMFWYFIFLIFLMVLYCKLTCGWCYSKVCLVGKTAIITGGNSGIGYQTALALASRGCRVIIADKEDASESRDKILEETNNKNVLVKKLDLASLDSVRKFAEDVIQTEPKLDILINNAGIGSTNIVYTPDGLLKTMQVNYFGHFLLTYLLLDLLKKSAPSRIVFTSSTAAFFFKMNLSDLNPVPKNVKKLRVYSYSKLALIASAQYLSEKLEGNGVTVNTLHPGGVKSGIFLKSIKDTFSIYPIILGLFTLIFGKNTEEGAQTIIHLACEKRLQSVSGNFFMDCSRFIKPYQCYNMKFCKDIFEESKRLVNLKPEECSI